MTIPPLFNIRSLKKKSLAHYTPQVVLLGHSSGYCTSMPMDNGHSLSLQPIGLCGTQLGLKKAYVYCAYC